MGEWTVEVRCRTRDEHRLTMGRAVRWGVAGQIVMAWVFTIPACFLLAWTLRSLLALLGV